MAPPWRADVALGGEQVKELLSKQFPELAPHSLELLGAGWDNTAWLVNQTYVFRFPRRQLGAECLQTEVAVLPRIADRLPRPISAPTLIGQPAGDYPWLFAGYPLLPGQPGRRCFFEVDGETEEAVLHLAGFRALDHTLSLLHYADETGNDPLLKESLQSLDFLRIP